MALLTSDKVDFRIKNSDQGETLYNYKKINTAWIYNVYTPINRDSKYMK